MSGELDYLTDRGPGSGRRSVPRSWLDSDAPRIDLSGEWDFRLHPVAPRDAGVPAFAAADADADSADADADASGDWESIIVPSHWVLTGDGRRGAPIYTNVRYPFPVEPPLVPDANPTGDHRRSFEVEPAFLDSAEQRLRFDGVESRYRIWLNGVEIGVGSGSRLAQEFDITGVLRPGRNVLAVRVHQWSAASYLEDQDQWWLPGIFREVTVLALPTNGIRDLWLRTGYRDGVGTLAPELDAAFPVRLEIAELGLRIDWAGSEDVLPVELPAVEPWSAERPRLYTATVSSAGERITQRIGFRTVAIDGDRFTVNGERLVFRGVNRHETHPDRGRVFDEAHARADLELMKRSNVNAIRTSHYPPHPRLLDLADEIGLWVILECDLETHGFDVVGWKDNPSDDPRWREAYLDRIERTVERDKNHASIVLWSLGNEAGTGANLAAMAAWVHDRDPGRPVHYEGDYSGAYTDVYSRMYATLAELASIGGDATDPLFGCSSAESVRQRSKPFLLCEYAHAMGNGPGALAEYDALAERYPRLHGGFVWEWRDHGIRTRTADGTEFFGYGGDFGEVLHDGNFVMDGMVLSDDSPSPAVAEFAAVQAPVLITVGVERIRVVNRRHSAGTDDLRFAWRVEHDGREAAAGTLDVPVIAAGTAIEIPVPEFAVAASGETWLTVEAVLAEDATWAAAGHVLARAQRDATPVRAGSPIVTVRGTGTRPSTSTGTGTAVLRDGALVELGGLAAAGPRLAVFRAPTDNDSLASSGSYDGVDAYAGRGAGTPAPPWADVWRAAGLDRLVERRVSLQESEWEIAVHSRWAAAADDRGIDLVARWSDLGQGRLRLAVDLVPSKGWAMVWPRLGIRIDLPSELSDVEWFGLGPGEAYPDSAEAAFVGRFRSSIDDLATPYARPQETGHRPEFRELLLSAGDGRSVRVEGLPDHLGRRPGFTVGRHTAEELAAAAHPHELPPSTGVHLYVDAAQNGLGSRSCGMDVLPEHALRPEARHLKLLFSV